MPRALIALTLLVLAPLACGEEASAELALSWSFEDGLDCAELGVDRVDATINAARVIERSFACEDGLDPTTVTLGPFDASLLTLELEAYSGDDQLLFRGGGRVDVPRETAAHVVLQRAP